MYYEKKARFVRFDLSGKELKMITKKVFNLEYMTKKYNNFK